MKKPINFSLNQTLRWVSLLAVAAVVGCSDNEPTPMLRPLPDQSLEKVVQAKPNGMEIRKPMVEILFVIDDSGSMSTHQENLKKNASQFVLALKQNVILDYRIGVTTTSEQHRGKFLGPTNSFVTTRTPNGLEVLAESMIVGTSGDATEKALPQILPIVKNDLLKFSRRGSYLAVVIVTDAEDQSDVDPAGLYAELVNLKGGDPDRVLLYGAIVPSDDTMKCSRDGGENEKPVRIEQFLTMAFGNGQRRSSFNLCSPDFGLELAGIAEDIVDKVGSRITLDKAPDPERMVVRYGNIVIPNHPTKGWTYDPKTKSINIGREVEWPDDNLDRELTISYERAIYPQEREHAKK
ncbi:MAG: VWA domain-containing protein [Bdellovibrionales bacterium]|nr:VWA domain-containing protein [Bdellovibrionales bacterium]